MILNYIYIQNIIFPFIILDTILKKTRRVLYYLKKKIFIYFKNLHFCCDLTIIYVIVSFEEYVCKQINISFYSHLHPFRSRVILIPNFSSISSLLHPLFPTPSSRLSGTVSRHLRYPVCSSFECMGIPPGSGSATRRIPKLRFIPLSTVNIPGAGCKQPGRGGGRTFFPPFAHSLPRSLFPRL